MEYASSIKDFGYVTDSVHYLQDESYCRNETRYQYLGQQRQEFRYAYIQGISLMQTFTDTLVVSWHDD